MTPRQDLEAVRTEVLGLHKRLIDDARAQYEAAHGEIEHPGELQRLVAFDPEFAWLHPLSQLILDIDDRLEHEPVTREDSRFVHAELERIFGPQVSSAGPQA